MHVFYEIQIDVARHAHLHSAYEHCRISDRHIYMSVESERSLIMRIKSQRDTRVTVHSHSVDKIEFIEVRSQTRQRTDKTVAKQLDIVTVKIDFTKHVLQQCTYIFLRSYFVYTYTAVSSHILFLAARRAAEKDSRILLLYRNIQHRFS